jgi:hypothetical protein
MLSALALVIATSLPVIPISVEAGPEISRSTLSEALEEADAIWRDSGIRLSWEICSGKPAPGRVHLIVESDRRQMTFAPLPIGWVIFEEDRAREVHLSYGAAYVALERAMPTNAMAVTVGARIDRIIARGLGRALAHELGHYLLASKTHARDGLMHAVWTPLELFGAERPIWRLDAEQRDIATSKIAHDFLAQR